jgi:N-acetylmuramoyl-L-alanine amidase
MASTKPFYRRYFVPLLIVLVFVFVGWRGLHTASPMNAGNASSNNQQQAQAKTKATALAKVVRVGIQAGHWKVEDAPSEMPSLVYEGGASVSGVDEWRVNLDIANLVADILRGKGITVDVLPATIPEGYHADAFIAIHQDGNDDTSVSGFKVASSEYDTTGKADTLKADVIDLYSKVTSLVLDPDQSVSDDMTGYYAFNFTKYTHAIDSSTPGIIVECGFLTNSQDRYLLTHSTNTVAEGLAEGIEKFLGL